jgi:tyrosinase
LVIRLSLSCVCDSDYRIDAPDFYESSWWKDSDPVSGLGGWGDPNDDFTVPDGGFHQMPLSYPSPHTVRRNFSLLSFDQPSLATLFPDPLKLGNTSFTASVVKAILETSAGDYRRLQVGIEVPEVRKIDSSNITRFSSS